MEISIKVTSPPKIVYAFVPLIATPSATIDKSCPTKVGLVGLVISRITNPEFPIV